MNTAEKYITACSGTCSEDTGGAGREGAGLSAWLVGSAGGAWAAIGPLLPCPRRTEF